MLVMPVQLFSLDFYSADIPYRKILGSRGDLRGPGWTLLVPVPMRINPDNWMNPTSQTSIKILNGGERGKEINYDMGIVERR